MINDIKIVGTGCDKCDSLMENTEAACKELGIAVKPIKVTDLVEMVKLGVMSVPALMVNGKILHGGSSLKTDKIKKLLEKNM